MNRFLLQRIGLASDGTSQAPTMLDCIEAVLGQSDVLMAGVLEGLAPTIGQPRPQASYGATAPVKQTAADYLGRQSSSVQKTFCAELRRVVYQPTLPDEVAPVCVRFDDLQLLDSGEIDSSIELALAEQEVGRGVQDVLPKLDALVSSLLGWTTVQAQLNPLKPKAFVRALQATLTKHAPDEEARSSLILPTAGLLGVGLRQLYKEVCDWLRAQGIEPAQSVGAMSALGGGLAVPGAQESTLSRRLLTLDKLRKLLTSDLEFSPGPPGFLHTVPASFVAMEDLKLVEPMMKRLAQRAKLAIDGESRSKVARRPAEHEPRLGKQLGQQLGVEVVGMMVERLAQDHRLLAPIQDLMRALEPVLNRLAQSDPRFFSDRQHPARQFLDQLTHRSLAFSDEAEEGFAVFLDSISIATQSLFDSACDASAFAHVCGALSQGWAREEEAQRQRQEETARALLRTEQKNLLAARLASEFRTRTAELDIAPWVREFLCGPWSQVVAQSQLACVDGRADPEGFLALVDELLWSVQVRRARRNRRRLVRLVPDLLVKLRQGLQLIQYPSERIPLVFDALISIHEQAFDGPRAQAAVQIDDAASQDAVQAAPHQGGEALAKALEPSEPGGGWMSDLEAQESGFMGDDVGLGGAVVAGPWSAQDLGTGVWVELLVDGAFLRAQLTWVSPHRTLFMFIARSGSAHSMSRRTMDRLRMRGAIRVVSDGHLVDGALDAVALEAMQNQLSRARPFG